MIVKLPASKLRYVETKSIRNVDYVPMAAGCGGYTVHLSGGGCYKLSEEEARPLIEHLDAMDAAQKRQLEAAAAAEDGGI